MRFRTEVQSLARVGGTWRVSWTSLDSSQVHTDEFDCVVAAHGRCNVPYIPPVPGIEHFRGRQMHSAWYRFPDKVGGRRILVVGNNSSGGDVARELSGGTVRSWPGADAWAVACRNVDVFQAYHRVDQPPSLDYDPRDASSPAWCRRIHVVSTIDHVASDGSLVLQDGSHLKDIDTIVWCTGFLFQASFADTTTPFDVAPLIPRATQGVRVAPDVHAATQMWQLDDWMLFYKGAPGLCFLGVPNRIVPFPMAQLQARCVLMRLLTQRCSAPVDGADAAPASDMSVPTVRSAPLGCHSAAQRPCIYKGVWHHHAFRCSGPRSVGRSFFGRRR